MSGANVKPRKRRPEPKDRLDAQESAGRVRRHVTYQLLIEIECPVRVRIGRFGEFDFPAGRYVYTGSARRNFEARIARHLRTEKALRWHIDYLLAVPGVRIAGIRRYVEAECAINRTTPGSVVFPGFGASDCRAGCGSHLKYLG